MTEETAARQRLARLQALAGPLAGDLGIGVSAGQGWSWNPATRIITVDENDLQRHSAEYCMGILAHEIAHSLISRYLDFEFPERRHGWAMHLLNAIEDPRIEHWIMRRYPGTVSWLNVAHEQYLSNDHAAELPDFSSFALGCAWEPRRGWRPDNRLSDPVRQALDETREARRAYAELVPPVQVPALDILESLRGRYRDKVVPLLVRRAWFGKVEPSAMEQAVLLSAAEALELARAEILPWGQRLFECSRDKWLSDSKRQEPDLTHLPPRLRERLVALLKQLAQAIQDLERRRLIEQVLVALSRLRDEAGECLDRQTLSTALRLPEVTATPASMDSDRPSVGLRSQPAPTTEETGFDWHQESRRLAPYVHDLERKLEALLVPRRHLDMKSGFTSGSKLDLRRLAKFEADPRVGATFWQRANVPTRHRTVFSLLIDCSGSMGWVGRIEAALQGALVLITVLERLEVPFAVNGFQDKLIRVHDIQDRFDQASIERLIGLGEEVHDKRVGGNNQHAWNDDGPCLAEAAEELLAYPADSRVMIVISDGLPEGKHSTEDDLRDVIARLSRLESELKLIGLGLGEGADHVKDFYPHAVAGVRPEDCFAEMGQLVSRCLLEAQPVGPERAPSRNRFRTG